LPDGQSLATGRLFVAPDRRRKIRLHRRANQVHISCRLGLATEGRFAIVTNAGWRCGGRVGLQRDLSCGRTNWCDGEIVWSWHPDADAKPVVDLQATVANKPGHRGDHV